MSRKPTHLGRTLSKMNLNSPVVRIESRDLNDDEKAAIETRKQEQAARLARIAARSKKS